MFRQVLAGILVALVLVAAGLSAGIPHYEGTVLTDAQMTEITGTGEQNATAAVLGSMIFAFGLTAAVVGIAVLSAGVATPAVGALYLGYVVGGSATASAGWGAVWCGTGNC